MGKLKDLTGMKFGRLTVVERAENNKHGQAMWLCQCDCGNEIIVQGHSLMCGRTKSCGCRNSEVSSEIHTTHGLSDDKAYNMWCNIKQRCFNPNHQQYKDYGGRRITMYAPWINDFKAFYKYVSQLPHFGEKGYSLDRIDNNGNYEPDNLRYATKTEQNRNRRDNHIAKYKGQKMALPEAAEKSGISYYVLRARYKIGDRGERLFRPVRKFNRK